MMTVEEINNFADLEKLRSQWNLLVQGSETDSFFLTYEWISSWWKTLGTNKSLFILLVKEGGEIVAIAPLMISRGTLTRMPLCKIEFIGAGWGHGDFIFLKKKEESLQLIWDYLSKNFKNWDALVLSRIVARNGNFEIIERTLRNAGFLFIREKELIPYISLHDQWDNYLLNRSYSFRRNFKNRERRMKSNGNLRLCRYNKNIADVQEVMNTVFNISLKSWKAQEGTAIALNNEVKDFYLELATNLNERKWLDISVLYSGDKAISYMFGAIYGQKYIDIDIAFDTAYSSCAPGNLHRCYVLKQLFEENLKEFDFVLQFDYKKYFTDSTKEFNNLFIFKKDPYSMLHFLTRAKILPLYEKIRTRYSKSDH